MHINIRVYLCESSYLFSSRMWIADTRIVELRKHNPVIARGSSDVILRTSLSNQHWRWGKNPPQWILEIVNFSLSFFTAPSKLNFDNSKGKV